MDHQLFFNGGHPPPSAIAYESTSIMPLWRHLAPPPDRSPEKSLDSFFGPFSSVVPSPEASNSHFFGEGRELRELMGKLKGFPICNSTLSSPPKLHSPLMADGKLSRVSSLKELGSNSSFESTVSDQISEELICRKRKANSKEPIIQFVENSKDKRIKASEEQQRYENGRKEEKTSKKKSNSKAPEPPKDFIHVRARRGQATDSHSLAERVRREKISERMKLLEDLVPGCSKVTGKALMLDEIIKYVQSLQRQVEFLSMKLASVNTQTESAMDFLISKEVFDSNNSLSNPLIGSDSSSSSMYGHHHLGLQLPLINELTENLSQYPMFGEDNLQSIAHNGIGQFEIRDLEPKLPFAVPGMEIEL